MKERKPICQPLLHAEVPRTSIRGLKFAIPAALVFWGSIAIAIYALRGGR